MPARTSLPFILLLPLYAACSPGADEQAAELDVPSAIAAVEIPAEHQAGLAAFDANCAQCHGDRALGTEQGPPLVHTIYEPSHHADLAFVMAAQRGVRAHHWQFGDMPPLPHLEHEQILSIIAYVRFLQEKVGIV